MKNIIIESKKVREVINITVDIEAILKEHPAADGMLHLFLRHSTAALTTAFLEEAKDLDLIGAFEIMLPHHATKPSHEHTHHTDHLPAHVLASLLGPHLAIPVANNKLMLGQSQAIALVELNGPREREIVVDYKKSKEN